jgi:pimeloyl-ACP methyl ester carboxylesterase
MAVFVLIPGMWHGGWCWKKVTPLLRAAGHDVYTPTLTGLGERSHLRCADIDMHTHIEDVVNVLEYEDLREAILVGHSLGGFMVPAVAEKVPGRVAHLINLDGPIPVDGKSAKDLMPDIWGDFSQRAQVGGDAGWIPPIPEWTFGISGADLEWMMSKLTAHPLKTLETQLNFSDPTACSIPRTFIYCTEGASPEEIAAQEKECVRSNYQYRALATGHDAMITRPDEFVKILLELLR